jgi:RecJ-like exonuclease
MTERKLPMCWEICSACRGEGTTTRHIEPDGGGFTASEWAEACDGDDEFEENYFSGRYDRPCEECSGTGKVRVVDEQACSPEELEAWREECEAERYLRAERDAERRMGC